MRQTQEVPSYLTYDVIANRLASRFGFSYVSDFTLLTEKEVTLLTEMEILRLNLNKYKPGVQIDLDENVVQADLDRGFLSFKCNEGQKICNLNEFIRFHDLIDPEL